MTNKKLPPIPFMSSSEPELPELPPPLPKPEGVEFKNLPAGRFLALFRSPDRERRSRRRLIMITPSLDDKLRREASRRGDSINNTILQILEDYLQ